MIKQRTNTTTIHVMYNRIVAIEIGNFAFTL